MFVRENTEFLPSVVPLHKLLQETSKNILKKQRYNTQNRDVRWHSLRKFIVENYSFLAEYEKQ
jgi:hypothetical protein